MAMGTASRASRQKKLALLYMHVHILKFKQGDDDSRVQRQLSMHSIKDKPAGRSFLWHGQEAKSVT